MRFRRSDSTLQGMWIRTILCFLSIVVIGDLAFVGIDRFQRDTVAEHSDLLGRKAEALARLDHAMRDAEKPSLDLAYAADPALSINDSLRAFDHAGRRVSEALDDLVAADRGSWTALINDARTHWLGYEAGIKSTVEVDRAAQQAELVRGVDRFEPVWEHRSRLLDNRADMSLRTVVDLRAQVVAADRVRRVGTFVVGASFLAAAIVGVAAVRRFGRRVVAPTRALQRSAAALRNADLCTVPPLPNAIVELRELAATLEDTATRLHESHHRLRLQARTDALTALSNRSAFREHLESMAAARRPVAVLFVDLDDFKEVNDTVGHATGDEVLRVVAERLSSCQRAGAVIARLGGDEFAVALDGDDAISAARAAERIITAIAMPIQVGEDRFDVSCSIGIASTDGGREADPEGLLRDADFAMYVAKSRGKRCTAHFADDMHLDMLRQVELKADLGRAVVNHELELHLQPVFDLAAGDLQGFEALVRWRHPARGLLQPGSFIELAERTGDIDAIGTWVVTEACRALVELQAAAGRPLQMAVNVSAVQLGDALIDMVLAAIERSGIHADQLIVEITESAALHDVAAASEILTVLRDAGVRIAIDDFGTGFSSLRQLHDLPIDVLKIDRSFVVADDDKTTALLDGVVTMARRLRLAVVAEGVETQEQLERLRRLGPMSGQGYFLARPVPLGDAITMARSRAELTHLVDVPAMTHVPPGWPVAAVGY